MEPSLKEYYFTFGSGHAHPNGYYVIEAENEAVARMKMVTMFGKHWCTSYKSKKRAGVNEFGFTEVGRARVYGHEIQELESIAKSHYK